MKKEKELIVTKEDLADLIAEFNSDGKRDGTAWEFYRWIIKQKYYWVIP